MVCFGTDALQSQRDVGGMCYGKKKQKEMLDKYKNLLNKPSNFIDNKILFGENTWFRFS